MYLSHYRILGQIGQGQFGRVFCAIERQTGELIALKDLDIKRFSTKKFLRELDYLLTLQHPNIVACKGLQYHPGGRYLLMDYCEGGTLRDLIEAKVQLTLGQKLKLIEDILLGLAHAHSRQIVHCDIKPENILLNIIPNGWIARLSDFGIARLLEEPSNRQSGGYTGSPAYMAPERFYGKHSYPSDLYSVGIILYELLVGERPFSGYPGELMTAHMSRSAKIPQTIPKLLAAIIEISLRKLPQRRFLSAGEMLKEIRQAMTQLKITTSAPCFVLTVSPSTSVPLSSIITSFPSIPITHVKVESNYLYLGGENTLTCQSYADSNFSGSSTQRKIKLEGNLKELYTHKQGCITITQSNSSDYKISFLTQPLNTDNNYSFDISTNSLITVLSPQKNWLAIATDSTFQVRNLPDLSPLHTHVICPLITQLVYLDTRHGLAISHPNKYTTYFHIFNRRGGLIKGLSLPITLYNVTSNPYFPYYLLAIEPIDPPLGILIKLKPFKVTRISLEINPAFILPFPWGYCLADMLGNILLITEKGDRLAKYKIEGKLKAIAPLAEFKIIVVTESDEQVRCLVLPVEIPKRRQEEKFSKG